MIVTMFYEMSNQFPMSFQTEFDLLWSRMDMERRAATVLLSSVHQRSTRFELSESGRRH